MRTKPALLVLALTFLPMASPLPASAAPDWDGVDKKVVEKFASDAGRSPREPLINTDRGDLLLFVFLVAGAVGGFVAGYCFRALFPPGGGRKA